MSGLGKNRFINKKNFFKKNLRFLILGVLGFSVFLVLFSLAILKDLPSVDKLTSRQIVQSTKIYDRSGENLLYEVSGDERRTIVPFEEIPQFLKDATITVEDEGFYQESAIDWRGIIRAFWVNLRYGEIRQGGSTITQQLARSAFLSTEQTITRKLKELVLAIQLNRRYPKDDILWLYLNQIPYGPTAYGVESASQAYFNKPVKDINLAESAILAAIPKAPSYYSPWGSHVKELLERQKFILKKMSDTGKIDEEQYEAAIKTEVSFKPRSQGIKAPHFVIAVQDYLVQKYGEDMARTGGLRVITTLDAKLQELGEKAVAEGAERNENLYGGKNSALVAEDPKTGQILAMVGSRDYFDIENEGNFNVATQGFRQPGSALKPFAYLTAFDKGYTPDTIIFDTSTEFVPNNPECPITPNYQIENKKCFHPQNFDNQFRGPVDLKHALAQSINVPSVKVLYLAGVTDTLKNIANLGIKTLTDPNRYGLSLVLGGGEVKLIELVGAYSALAENGTRHEQTMILEVKDSGGKILETYKDKAESAVGSQSARLINDILSDTSLRAGLFQGSLGLTVFPNYEVALKTGTTNDYRDAWAMGYAPFLAVGVWAGNNDNSPMHRQGSSILAAVPIWHDFMAEAIKNYQPETFARPDPVLAQKPILRGDYLAGNQVHSILYYVDRRDPDGQPPLNPQSDPQFDNWEQPVLEWARRNIQNFSENYNKSFGVQPQSGGSIFAVGTPPQIRIQNPKSGSFVGSQINLVANITGSSGISKIRVYMNNKTIQEFSGSFGSSYELNWSFSPQDLGLQNLLQVEAIDENNRSGKSEAIVYR